MTCDNHDIDKLLFDSMMKIQETRVPFFSHLKHIDNTVLIRNAYFVVVVPLQYHSPGFHFNPCPDFAYNLLNGVVSPTRQCIFKGIEQMGVKCCMIRTVEWNSPSSF